MPTTLTIGLDYPAPGDTPDVPYWMQRLAEDVDDWADRIVHDSTWQTGAMTAIQTANWTVNGQYFRRFGPIITGVLSLAYKGASVTPPGDGNVGDILIGTVSADFRGYQPGGMQSVAGRMVGLAVASNGQVSLATVANTAPLTAGAAFVCQGTWFG